MPQPILLGLALLLLVACGDTRPEASTADLARRAVNVAQQQIALRSEIRNALLSSLEADLAAGREGRLDVLLLSGGGSWGAFGAGFLNGWSSLPANHPQALPRFDLVSGVSTGALMSPFVLIGTPAYLTRLENVYRSCSDEWAPVRSMLSLASANSLLDTTVFDKALRDQLDEDMARELIRLQDVEHRQALVASSDVDLGRAVLWNLAEQARKGLAQTPYDPDSLFRPLRASAAIPGAFAPVEVEGSLHVDGAVYGQIHVLSDMAVVDRLVAGWRQKAGPESPLPKIRYWVILNNRLKVTNKTIQPHWGDCSLRSIELMLNAQVAAPLNRLALFVESMRMKHKLDVELRWVQIPTEWTSPPDVSDFHPSVTNSLADLGRRMGADPASWLGLEQLGTREVDSAAETATAKP